LIPVYTHHQQINKADFVVSREEEVPEKPTFRIKQSFFLTMKLMMQV